MKVTVKSKPASSFNLMKMRFLTQSSAEIERMLTEAYEQGRDDAIQSDDIVKLLNEVRGKIDKAQVILQDTMESVNPSAFGIRKERLIDAINCLKQNETRFTDETSVSANYVKAYNAALKDVLAVVDLLYINGPDAPESVETNTESGEVE